MSAYGYICNNGGLSDWQARESAIHCTVYLPTEYVSAENAPDDISCEKISERDWSHEQKDGPRWGTLLQ